MIDSIQRDKKKDRAVFDICLEKLIEQSEAGKCLVIGTIMADCLIIKQQFSVFYYKRSICDGVSAPF